MKRLIVAALLVVTACGGGATATPAPSGSQEPTVAPSPSVSLPAQSPASSPAGDSITEAVSHIVGRIDDLSAIVTAGGDNLASDTNQWFVDEARWISDHLTSAMMLEDALSEYVKTLVAALEKLQAGLDLASDAASIIALRSKIAVLAPPAATPAPTAEPSPVGPDQYAPGHPVTVAAYGDDWAVITVTKVEFVSHYDGPNNLDDTPRPGYVYVQLRVTYNALVDGVDYNTFDWQIFTNGIAGDDSAYVSNGPTQTLGSGTLPKG